jgi:DNA-binding Xre family transcriptional regulator
LQLPRQTDPSRSRAQRQERTLTSPTWDANVAEYRRATEHAIALGKLRESRNVTQVDLAAELGISQGNVSRMESRSEIYLSTLRSYIEALGGHLEITAVFDDDDRVPVAVGASASEGESSNTAAAAG